jgi:hypothetical protein
MLSERSPADRLPLPTVFFQVVDDKADEPTHIR